MSNRLLGLIRDREWHKLVEDLELAIVPMVREFYVNVYEHQGFRVFVRGKMVPFDRSTINMQYQLFDIDNDEFHNLLETNINWNQMIKGLCESGTQWQRKSEGAIQSFSCKAMDKCSKVCIIKMISLQGINFIIFTNFKRQHLIYWYHF